MVLVSLSGLTITGGRFEIYKGYGFIHILSIITLFSIATAIWAIRKRRIKTHASAMIFPFVVSIVAALLALFMPDRLLNQVFFN